MLLLDRGLSFQFQPSLILNQVAPQLYPSSTLLFLGQVSMIYVFFTRAGVKSLTFCLQSLLIFNSVLPRRVLKSPLFSLAKYLTLLLGLVVKVSVNFTYLLQRSVFGWAQFEIVSIKYPWVCQGTLSTFLTVTFQDLKILSTSTE